MNKTFINYYHINDNLSRIVILKQKNIFFVFFVLIFSASMYQLAEFGSRDFDSYVKYFSCLSNDSCDVFWSVEPSAVIIAKIFEPILGAKAVVFLYILLAVSLKFLAFQRMRNFALVYFIYALSFSVLFEITQIRVAVAVGFCILSIQSYLESRRLHAAFLFSCGVFFHISSLTILALLMPTSLILIVLSVFIFFSEFLLDSFGALASLSTDAYSFLRLSSFQAYLDSNLTSTVINHKNLLSVLISIPIIFKWILPPHNIIVTRACIVMWVTVLGIYGSSSGFFSRLSDIFLAITIVLVIGSMRKHLKFKILMLGAAASSCVASLRLLT